MGSSTSDIGTEIRRRRLERGWTQMQLAVAAGLSLKTVELIEGGKSNPRRATLTVIDLALDEQAAA